MGPPETRGWIATLWSGALPLPVAFWHFGIVYGLIVNVLATVASLALFAGDAPGRIALAVHFAPMPYNVLVLVGVWRCAARWQGERRWADLARAAITLWFAACTAL
jgi:hypothetical protein